MLFSIRCRLAMPGPYADHHVHLLASAAARLSIDVSGAKSIGALLDIVAAGQAGRPGWTRAWGYEEWALAERRHPTWEDLDRLPGGRPLVLHHRSGHAAVLNRAALAEIGAADHPDGVLFDRHDLLARVPRLPAGALEDAAGAMSRKWWSAGLLAVTDATHTNGPDDLETLAGWVARGSLKQSVTAMVSLESVGRLPPFGAHVGQVRVGCVKLMPAAGRLDQLAGRVSSAHAAGYPVAVHVVDVDVLEATLLSFEASPPPAGQVDRIEHNALCLPEQVPRIAAAGATVVVNPGFLVHRRGKYEQELSEVERSWLVRIGSLLRAGIDVRAGSDSPVTPWSAEEIVAAASDHPFAPEESISPAAAERLLVP